MLSVDVEVSVFDGGLEIAVVVVFVLIGNFLFHNLKLVGVKVAVADEVSKKLDGLADILFEDLHLEGAILTASLALETSAHAVDCKADFALGAAWGSTEEHLLEEVGSA